MAKREASLDPGTVVQLTSLRTRRKVQCTTAKLLGLGGMAKVYGGELEDGTQVVLKMQRFEGRGADHSLEVEIELFKKLFHRNIVHCVGVGITPAGHLIIGFRRAYQNPLLLMAKASVDEGMRRDKRARYPCLPLDTAIDLTYELLNALAYLERLGFVHHDVKLANLLIDVASKERPLEGNEVFGRVVRRNYRAVLIDFGATRSRNYLEAWNRGEAPEGIAPQITPFYAPPEAVVETRRADGELGLTFHPSIDVYAAALLLYALISGHPPYSHLKTPPDHNDMESVIAAKSAERRGEISAVSDEIVRRVVFEDTRFTSADRAAFDLALHRFLVQRLDPNPEARGSAADMKRDFERLCCIRSRRGHEEEHGVGGSRVFLPFQQDLASVGEGREHPLLRAARLYGLEAGAATRERETGRIERGSESGRFQRLGEPAAEPARRRRDSERLRAPTPDPQAESMDWLQEMDATAPAPASRPAPPPRSPPPAAPSRTPPPSPGAPLHGSRTPPPGPGAPPRRAPPPPQDRPPQRPPSERARVPSDRPPPPPPPSDRLPRPSDRIPRPPSDRIERPGEAAGPSIQAPRPTSPLQRQPRRPHAPTPPPTEGGGGWGHTTEANVVNDDLLRRAGRRRRSRRTISMDAARVRDPGLPAAAGASPTGRGYPPEEVASAPHCLLSPVLDTPLLLSRERVYHIGRDPTVEVRIKSDLVSRRHAEVAWDGRAFVVKDLGSLNGTSLNGFRLKAPTPLHDEDRIGFGGFEFVVRVLSGAEWTVDDRGGSTRILKGEEDWGKSHTPSFAGDLTRLALRDVIEIIDWKHHSGTLTITENEQTQGVIWFSEGRMLHAEQGTTAGLDAAVQLFTTRRGSFVFTHGRVTVPRSIEATLEEVWRLVRERHG